MRPELKVYLLRHKPDDVAGAAKVAAAKRGCRCDPEYRVTKQDGVTRVTVAHNAVCPVVKRAA